MKKNILVLIILCSNIYAFRQIKKQTALQDTIFERYLKNGAYKYHYTMQGWDDNINIALAHDSTFALLYTAKSTTLLEN